MSACGQSLLYRCVCASALLITVAGAPDNPASWIRSQPQQTLHGLMVSIDERLHSLENTRWDTSLKQIEQRLDSLENTIRRLDSAFQDRLDKLERNLNSKELKDELTVEKLTHKLRDISDSNYDRYNRRLGYTEERLEMSFKKVQMSLETSLNRIEKQQEDIQTEVVEAVTILEDLKGHHLATEDKLNSTHKDMKQHIQSMITPSHEELQRISGSLDHLGSRLNSSLGMWGSQSDGPQVSDVITTVRTEINSEATKFTSKMSNMYNDLWRRVASTESLVKDLSRLTNTTQRDVLEEMRSLVVCDRRDFPGDSQENFIEVALDALERKLQRKLLDLGRKMDDRLDTLSATQNLVMDSCFDGGICRGLESKLSQVLERIFDVFSDKIEGFSNRTFDLDGLVMEMMELIKMQHSHLIRTVTHNTNMVVTLAKDSSDSSKQLHNSVTQLAEKTDYNFQELHDEVHKICNASGNVCTDGNKNNRTYSEPIIPKEISLKNITEVNIVTVNTTQPNKNITKHHDTGVLKITTDDIDILADNTTLAKQTKTDNQANRTRVVNNHTDASIMQIINTISPNLTHNQLETILHFLNRSVSLENLEAIIQNTEAVSEEESNVESFDNEPVNRTKTEGIAEQNTTVPLPENSGEMENISDETNEDSDPNEMAEALLTPNMTEVANAGNKTGRYQADQKVSEMPTNLKDHLKLYTLLVKIKHDSLNITELCEQIENTSNQSTNKTQKLLPLLQRLCYGKENVQDFNAEYINDAMRNRLLLINQTINDVSLYEKIENVCNTMIETIRTHHSIQEVSQED